MTIYVNPNELSSSQLRKTNRQIEKAQKQIATTLSKANGTYGYGGRLIFSGQLSEIQACYSAINEMAAKLEKYASLLDSAPDALIDIDVRAKNALTSGWERTFIGIGSFLGVLPAGTVAMSSGGVVDVQGTLEDNAKDIYEHVIDSGRKTTDRASASQVMYSSKKHKIVNGLLPGTHYNVTSYTDYKEISAEEASGDNFYKASGGLSMQAQHFEIESNEGTEIAIDVNSLNANLGANLDLAKGNAYVKGGLEYDLVKAELVDYENDILGVGLSAKAGVGAHANAGFHDGKFTVDVGAAFIGGVNVKLELDYEAGWNKIRSIFV